MNHESDSRMESERRNSRLLLKCTLLSLCVWVASLSLSLPIKREGVSCLEGGDEQQWKQRKREEGGRQEREVAAANVYKCSEATAAAAAAAAAPEKKGKNYNEVDKMLQQSVQVSVCVCLQQK